MESKNRGELPTGEPLTEKGINAETAASDGVPVLSDAKLAEALMEAVRQVEREKKRVATYAEGIQNYYEEKHRETDAAGGASGNAFAPEEAQEIAPQDPAREAENAAEEISSESKVEETLSENSAEEETSKNKTEEAASGNAAGEGAPEKKEKLWPLILLVVIFIAVAITAFWLVYGQYHFGAKARDVAQAEAAAQASGDDEEASSAEEESTSTEEDAASEAAEEDKSTSAEESESGSAEENTQDETDAEDVDAQEANDPGEADTEKAPAEEDVHEDEETASVSDTPISMDLVWDNAEDMPSIMTDATDPIGMAILQNVELGRGIGAITQVRGLYMPGDTGLAGADAAGEFEDATWETSDGRETTYADSLIACVLSFYRARNARINNGEDTVLSLIDPDSDLYAEVAAESGTGGTQTLDVLELGTVRQNGEDFYIITRVHEHRGEGSEETLSTEALRLHAAGGNVLVAERVVLE